MEIGCTDLLDHAKFPEVLHFGVFRPMYLGLLREIVSILVRILLKPNMRLIIVHSSIFF